MLEWAKETASNIKFRDFTSGFERGIFRSSNVYVFNICLDCLDFTFALFLR